MNRNMLMNMISYATKKHFGQFDKAGMPYILHPFQVMKNLDTDDEELQCIAIGHDLLEDTTATEDELLIISSSRVVNGIKALTKIKGESYEDYKKKVLDNIDAVRVKLADIEHNTDLSRNSEFKEKDFIRTAKYLAFRAELKESIRRDYGRDDKHS